MSLKISMVFFIKKATRKKKKEIYNVRFSVKEFSILVNTPLADLMASVIPALSNPFKIDLSVVSGSCTFQLSNVHARVSNQTFSTTF